MVLRLEFQSELECHMKDLYFAFGRICDSIAGCGAVSRSPVEFHGRPDATIWPTILETASASPETRCVEGWVRRVAGYDAARTSQGSNTGGGTAVERSSAESEGLHSVVHVGRAGTSGHMGFEAQCSR